MILVHTATKKIVPIPIHAEDIKRGLLRSVIRQTGLPVEEFCKLL
ncbi:type II toxin-antitoxin system HicA family toxin [Candidatus Parcubacteria bacterium]|nr:type II toxin-antitoxin system HicA family toxin [Candidatus Parcubacteria bacterium]